MNRKLLALFLVLCLVLPLLPVLTMAEDEPTTVTDVLDASKFEATGTSYATFSGVKDASNAVYAGKTAKNYSGIQLNSKDNIGIVCTGSGGLAYHISISWIGNTTAGRVLQIYGKNTPYESAADLYDTSKQGNSVAEITYDRTDPLNEVELTAYKYIGIRSQSGALYLESISITWDTTNVSDKYTVEFDANGGEGTMAPVETGSPYELPECGFTPPEGMVFDCWMIEGDEAHYFPHDYVEISGTTVFYAQWKAAPVVCAITFDANGGTGEMPGATVESGSEYVLPTCTFTSPEGHYFSGWKIDGGDGTLYAEGAVCEISGDTVFVAQWAEGYEDILTYTLIGATGTGYTDWSEIKCNSTAYYAGQSAGGNKSIQLRATRPSGIVTAVSGGLVKRIAVTWNSNTTAGRTLDIYGKNTPYTSADDLYEKAAVSGTKIGSIVCGTSTSIVITGEYRYIGIRSNSGALYLDEVKIDWEKTEPAFKTESLTLGGEIGVNFYMDLSMLSETEKANSYMTFTVGTENKPVTSRFNYDAAKTGENNTYGFTCYINAIQMADEIKPVFHCVSNGVQKDIARETAYSANLYIIKAQDDAALSASAKALARALADYGHYTQLYLQGLRNWKFGDDYTQMTLHYTDSYTYSDVASATADYAIAKEHDDPDIAEIKYSLVLDSKTTIRLYFTLADAYAGTFTATVGGKEVEAKKQGNRYLVEIENIGADKLGDFYAVVATTANGKANVSVSALSYVYGMLTYENATDEAKDAVCSIYNYWLAAQAYLG